MKEEIISNMKPFLKELSNLLKLPEGELQFL